MSAESGLEEYIAQRRETLELRARWELDAPFVALAMTLWPADMEGSALGRESNRTRMRLRYEGHKANLNAIAQIEALRDAAIEALEHLKSTNT